MKTILSYAGNTIKRIPGALLFLAAAALFFTGCPMDFDMEKLSVLQDNAAPVIIFDTPAAGSAFESAVTVTGTITDYNTAGETRSGASYIAEASWHLYGQESEVTAIEVDDDGSFSFSLATAPFTNQITLIVTATDKNGNTGSGSITLVPDTDGPFLVITSPEDYSEYATMITLSGYVWNSATNTATDEVDPSVSYAITSTAISGTLTLDETGAFSTAVDVSTLTGSSSRTLEVTASDLNGNTTTGIITIVKPADGGDISEFTVQPGNKQVTISWNPVTGAESYTLNELSYGGERTGIAATETSLVWKNLDNGKTYSFQLTARMPAGGASDAVSAEVSAIPLSDSTLCPRVEDSYQALTVEWQDFDTISEYTVERSLSPDGPCQVRRKLSGNSFTDTDVDFDTPYYYRVYPSGYGEIISQPGTGVPGRYDPAYAVGAYENTAGRAFDVAVSGRYAYVADQANGLVIIDISDPDDPITVGHCDTDGDARGVAVSGGIAYVADYDNGVVVINVSDPRRPVQVGSAYTMDGTEDWVRTYDVAISGNYLYVANWVYNPTYSTYSMVIFDINDPKKLTIKDTFDATSVATATLSVAASGNYAYLGENTSSGNLFKINIVNPENPVVTGKFSSVVATGGSIGDLAVSDGYIYLTHMNGDGLMVYNINGTGTPYETGSSDSGSYTGVAVDGDRAYAGIGNIGLDIIDISDPAAPGKINSVTSSGSLRKPAISGDYLFLTAGDKGVAVIDICKPGTPSPAGASSESGFYRDVVIAGDYAYVADSSGELVKLDISDPDDPSVEGTYSAVNSYYYVHVSGDYAYLSDRFDGFFILDVSAPGDPALAGSFTARKAYGLTVEGSLAYVAAGSDGFSVVDITDPADPEEIGYFSDGSFTTAYDVAVSGNYAYVATAQDGLAILDVSDPTDPGLVNLFDLSAVHDFSYPPDGEATDSYIYSLAAAGDYLYLLVVEEDSDTGGLVIIDVSNPAIPSVAGDLELGFGSYGIDLSGDFAFIANYAEGLRVVDISDPAAPVEIGFDETTVTSAYGAAVSGSIACVADGSNGVQVFRLHD